MADPTLDGPPQEGLDPKLKFLTDLAPATAGPTPAGFVAADHLAPVVPTPIAAPPVAAIDAALGGPPPGREGPPQFGQDPKLLACVNDGRDVLLDVGATTASAATAAAASAGNGVSAAILPDATPDSDGVRAPIVAERDGGAPRGNSDGAAPHLQCPTNAVAAAMLSIQNDASPPPPPGLIEAAAIAKQGQGVGRSHEIGRRPMAAVTAVPALPPPPTAPLPSADPPPPQPAANSNPNLTSSASLAEWNRIHTRTGPSYNFFKKSQAQGNRKIAWMNSAPPQVPVAREPTDDLVESSRARAASTAGAAVAASLMKPSPSPAGNMTAAVRDADASIRAHLAAPPRPPPVVAPPPEHPPEDAAPTNSNFWSQEEEERFLLGLRMYGWGQWKRIQSVVRTRTNKQIKSHAQKREKVNPQIKLKYGKGKSRRGRISSKVLVDDARAMALAGGDPEALAAGDDDGTMPGLSEAWMDVYGTNNGDGPNSRHRRHRNAAPAGRRAPQPTGAGGQQRQQQHPQPQLQGPPTVVEMSGLSRQPSGPLQPFGMMAGQQQHMHAGQPAASAPAAPPTTVHPPRLPPAPPAVTVAVQQGPVSRYSSTAMPVPTTIAVPQPLPALPAPIARVPQPLPAMPAPIARPTARPVAARGPPTLPSKRADTTSLRPGMRVYSRVAATDPADDRWAPGTIYSAKIDPAKLARPAPSGAPGDPALPLVFHIQRDDGGEDPHVPEEDVMSRGYYEAALGALEGQHAVVRPEGYVSQYPHPLEGGTPVYCQWLEASAPGRHGRWLPGTIHSCRPVGNGEHLYHVLFDTEGERRDIPQGCVVDRTEYHELAKRRKENPQHDRGGVEGSMAQLHDLFRGRRGHDGRGHSGANSDADAGGGQLDLLFTASQMQNHHGGAPTRKREGADGPGGAYKRQATELAAEQVHFI